ncbi:MAG: arylsulfatase, partial [Ferruginibacter sp.]|nr:arylsulfatase [Ferruginibacter sp.]
MKKIIATALLISSLLPIALVAQNGAEQTYQGIIGKTLADSKEWWAAPAKAPAGSPNVVVIILDDVGFGASST